MLKNLIELADGTQVFSGSPGTAVISVSLTRSVNTGTELNPGAVCAAMAEITLIDRGGISVQAGDEITLYSVDEQGTRQKTGIFIAEKPERQGALLKLTAYDRVIKLDKDLTGWLAELEAWPYTLSQLAQMVCAACGVELAAGQLPNGDFQVQKFTADGVTGRQLMGWIGQACCRFCRADPKGVLEFAWYVPAQVCVGAAPILLARADWADGVLTLQLQSASVTQNEGELTIDCKQMQLTDDGSTGGILTLSDTLYQQYYYQGGLNLQDFVTAPIEKVQLRANQSDVGTVYPDISGEVNTFIITGNPLLAALDAQTLVPVAQTLYEQLKDVVYTPCTLKLPVTPELDAGSILKLTDPSGREVSVYVMELQRDAQGDTLKSTGSARRDSTTAVSNQNYEALSGKVLNLRTDVDGIRAENADTAGKLATLSLDVNGIRGQVEKHSSSLDGVLQKVTGVEQTAENLHITVESIRTNGTDKVKTSMGYTFDDEGLHIAKSGEQMANRLDNTGMYVTRSGETILQANDAGVVATEVKVRNYLVVGDHARFEDHPGQRTACFWLGEG